MILGALGRARAAYVSQRVDPKRRARDLRLAGVQKPRRSAAEVDGRHPGPQRRQDVVVHATLAQRVEAGQRVGVEVVAAQDVRLARRGPRAPLGLQGEPGPDELERAQVMLAAGDRRAEQSEHRQRRHTQPVGPGHPRARLIEQRLADVEEDRLHPRTLSRGRLECPPGDDADQVLAVVR
jgi:hypothetical protein